MEKITKEEVFEIFKNNGLNEDEAEKLLEMLAKKSGGALIDVLKLVASKFDGTLGAVLTTLLAAGEPALKTMIDNIEVNL